MTKLTIFPFVEAGQFFLKYSPTENLLVRMILFYLYIKGCVQRRRDNRYFRIKKLIDSWEYFRCRE